MHCQKCRTPLRLDSSLENLNPAAFKILAGDEPLNESSSSSKDSTDLSNRPLYPQERLDTYERIKDQQPLLKQATPAKDARNNPAMSFVMLTESQISTPSTPTRSARRAEKRSNSDLLGSKQSEDGHVLSRQQEMANRLFEILSSRTDVDHPVCAECAGLLIDEMQKRLNSAAKERDAYLDFLRQANADVPSEEEVVQAKKQLEDSKREESEAFAELQRLEQEMTEVEQQLAALDAESAEMDKQEASFWRDRNDFALRLAESQDEKESANARYEHDASQLERLQRTNVYNDTFNIGHDGYYGTINGLRLGRLSNSLVDWPEINAAWGQACLLLSIIAEKLKMTFHGYTLKPMGSTSQIEKHEYLPQKSVASTTSSAETKTRVLNLYYQGDLLGMFDGRFDNGMVAFLDCVRQLGEHVEQMSSAPGNTQGAMRMPYKISKDKIGDASIKYRFNQEETWTKACKYTLTCCKYLLAHASNVSTGPGSSTRTATAG